MGSLMCRHVLIDAFIHSFLDSFIPLCCFFVWAQLKQHIARSRRSWENYLVLFDRGWGAAYDDKVNTCAHIVCFSLFHAPFVWIFAWREISQTKKDSNIRTILHHASSVTMSNSSTPSSSSWSSSSSSTRPYKNRDYCRCKTSSTCGAQCKCSCHVGSRCSLLRNTVDSSVSTKGDDHVRSRSSSNDAKHWASTSFWILSRSWYRQSQLNDRKQTQ